MGTATADVSDFHSDEGVNAVTLRGRLGADPVEAVLPSGTTVVNLRVVMPRAATAMTRGSAAKSDWMSCTAWSTRLRRRLLGWRSGDVVEIEGALRRRYTRGGLSSVEVEVLRARRLSRGITSTSAPQIEPV